MNTNYPANAASTMPAASLSQEEAGALVDAYLNEHWSDVLSDLKTLVETPSYREDDKARASEGAPFGPGPQKALSVVLEIAQRMGFATRNLGGYLGYADYSDCADAADVTDATIDSTDAAAGSHGQDNAAKRQIGIIGHVDVVPAGPGWSVEPYALTSKDGFLMGRGVADDKGPVIVALHAMNVWKRAGVSLPYNLRFLFGAAEETGMEDVAYYRQRFSDPDFLFTPDAEFPVCYGEKGHYDATLISAPFKQGVILDIQGGTAPNAVPGSAFAVVAQDAAGHVRTAKDFPSSERIAVTNLNNGTLRIDARGKCQHASLPEGGVNAIGLLVDFLLQENLCSKQERAFLQLEQRLLNATDGSGFDCACSDNDFGALTMVGGMISLKQGRIYQTIDCRYPACISVETLEQRIQSATLRCNATLQRDSLMEPFLVNPESPEVQTLLRVYNSVTGETAQPFTMGGGTYARMFKNAASFGPEKPWIETPDWVGGMHSPNEGVSEESLKEALRIYAHTLIELR